MNPHKARKRFGQHFLHDPSVIKHIISSINPTAEQHLLEIGPGLGALTWPLYEKAGRLDVVELDRDLAAQLNQVFVGAERFHLHQGDVLKFDLASVETDQKLRVVGNLPYNISTPLLFHLLTQTEHIQDMFFMLQKEVADRLVAAPGTSNYGRLSITVGYFCAAQRQFNIGPGAFRPPPKVESSIVSLTPYTTPPVAVNDEAHFMSVVKAAFSQRRKTLRNALKGVLDADLIREAGVDPGCRAETLGLAEFAALSNVG